MEEVSCVKSLKRAIRVLECFSIKQPELGVTEIAKMLHMQKSTTFNILNTFQQEGYIKQNPTTSKYYLSPKMLHMGYIVNHHMGMRDQFLPYLNRISEAVNERCYFGILDNNEVLYIEAVYPSNQQTRSILGERAPLYCTGLGKAMLAFLPGEEEERALNGPLDRFTPFTLCTPEEVRVQLEQIRQRGYAVDHMEHEYGICCVAVPVFDAHGNVMAAVSISGPKSHITPDVWETHARTIFDILQPIQRCL